ncbi:hypothetical protein Ae201684P_020365 [Aphanomyces euteiches]|nr:hypothetical protein Ae201684P_020365 [Aphanomyces euteiches]
MPASDEEFKLDNGEDSPDDSGNESEDDIYEPQRFVRHGTPPEEVEQEAMDIASFVCCKKACLQGKQDEIINFLLSMREMSNDQLNTCIYTTVTLL